MKEKKVIITKKKAKKKKPQVKKHSPKKKVGKKKSKSLVLSKAKKPTGIEPIIEKDNLDYLSGDHLRQIELSSSSVDNAKLKMHVQEQALVNARLRLTILNHEIELASKFAKDADNAYNNKKKARNILMISLTALYKIEGGTFGYDPDTGKIVRD